MRAGLFTVLIALAAAGPAAAAPAASGAQALGDFSRPCVVVVGKASTADPAGLGTFVAHGKAALALVAKELDKRGVRTTTVFNEPADAHEQGTRTIALMMRTQCVRYVQLACVAGQDASGAYFGYDVDVGHVVAGPGGPGQTATLNVAIVFSRKYHHPRTAQALARFDAAQDARRIAGDLLAGAGLPASP